MSSSPSRTAQFAKLYKVLKKSYPPVAPPPERQVLEHLVFAGCLENTHVEKAQESFATLVHTFFDWNEVRVTTVKELGEILAALPEPGAAAQRIKRLLQHVFETTYSFDLEELRKKNLGQAVERLRAFNGISEFVVAYVTQHALDGHAIPQDRGSLGVLRLLEMISDKDLEAGAVPGLERAIAKSKGVEFAALLHELGADFVANPYVPGLHKILLQINPDITAQLPKRRIKPKAEPAATAAAPDEAKPKRKKPGPEAPPPAAEPAAADSKPGPAKKKPVPAEKPEPPPAELVLVKKSTAAGTPKRKPR